jgi:Spy/CpxP family protein refolding chaperone
LQGEWEGIMKLKYKGLLFTIAIVITAIFILQTNAMAHEPYGDAGSDRHSTMERKMEKVQELLGLNDEQKARLKEHRRRHFTEVKELRGKIHSKMEELRKELEKASLDEGKVRAIHSDIKSLRIKEEDNRLEAILTMHKILTPEQHKKFMEIKKEGFKESCNKNGEK